MILFKSPRCGLFLWRNNMNIQLVRELLNRLICKSVSSSDLLGLLTNTEKPLVFKLGFDPTAPDLHFGHAIPLTVMSLLQKLGHHVHIIIGDFTAQIGDPTGKNVTRPPLDSNTIKLNSQTYLEQLSKFLDLSKTKVSFNSEWLDKLGTSGMIKLASHMTVSRMLERDDFGKRFKNELGIGIHEFLYPLLQGYDSVAIQSDFEIGGTDQEFNLHMGRNLQKDFGMHSQGIIMCPILEGLDGINKMSKSLNNFIAVSDSAVDQFGKIMSIKDDMIIKYFKLLTFKSNAEIVEIQRSLVDGTNPMQIKLDLAELIVTRFFNAEEAFLQRSLFVNRFSNRLVSTELPVKKAPLGLTLSQLLKELGFAPSTSQALKLIKEGAVKIDGVKVLENLQELPASFCLRSGKLNLANIVLVPNHVDFSAMCNTWLENKSFF